MKKGIISVLSILGASIVCVSAQELYEDDLYGSRRTDKEKPVKVEKVKVLKSDVSAPAKELVETIDDALLKRLEAYNSEDTFPKEYWNILDMYVSYLSKKYDEDLYNVIVVNGMAWVEPIYITSVFDNSDPTIGLNNYSKKFKQKLESDKKSSNVNVTINIVDPWDSWAYRPYSPWGMSYSLWGGHAPIYWGGGYYGAYWTGGFYPGWGGGYYPPYWGGGYYPPYWGGGHYPGWGGGYYPPHWGGGHTHNSRPVYYGNTRYGGSPSGGDRNGDYRSGQGFTGGRNNRVSSGQMRDVNTRQNTRTYDAADRFRGESTRKQNYTPPSAEHVRNQVNRENSFLRFQQKQDNMSDPKRPSYTPPPSNTVRNGGGFGGGGNSGGGNSGGGGGGIRNSR